MPVTRHWTTADVRNLIHENRAWPRYELLDGRLLVTPATRGPHQVACDEIRQLLHTYVFDNRIGVAITSPADLELQSGTIVQPDVFVVAMGAAGAVGREPQWSDISTLLLAVEILSPASLGIDRITKRDFYLASNVEEYWIVDLDARHVERWRPAREVPERLRDTLQWTPRDAAPLVIDLHALFDRIDAIWSFLRG